MILFDRNKDKVCIIGPSSGPYGIDARKVLEDASQLLSDSGFKVTYHPQILSKASLDFFASPKDIRSQGLIDALHDKDVKIIWALRGGYGATEIICDLIAPKGTGEFLEGKLLLGYSDITALHMLFNQHYGLPSLHAPVLMGATKPVIEEIISFFTKGNAEYALIPLNEPSLENHSAKKISNIEADIIGGNLAVFCNLIGTPLHPKTEGKILIFEDINENGYKIHRYLIHLHNAGLLKNIKAIIFGDFIGSNTDRLIEEAIMDFCLHYLCPKNIPCYRLHGFGHGKENHPITLGSKVILDVERNTIITYSPLHI